MSDESRGHQGLSERASEIAASAPEEHCLAAEGGRRATSRIRRLLRAEASVRMAAGLRRRRASRCLRFGCARDRLPRGGHAVVANAIGYRLLGISADSHFEGRLGHSRADVSARLPSDELARGLAAAMGGPTVAAIGELRSLPARSPPRSGTDAGTHRSLTTTTRWTVIESLQSQDLRAARRHVRRRVRCGRR